jgi:hypothetical protein
MSQSIYNNEIIEDMYRNTKHLLSHTTVCFPVVAVLLQLGICNGVTTTKS